MKIAFPYNSWRGGFLKSIGKACSQLGHETLFCNKYNPTLTNKILRRSPAEIIAKKARNKFEKEYNKYLFNQVSTFKPDIFFNISGSGLFPETIDKIHNDINAITISLVADNPCDPRRDKYFAMTLRYYDFLLLPEPIWMKIINNLAPKAKVIPFYGGYDPELFFPVLDEKLSKDDKQRFLCDASFTGDSYNNSGEGNYRAGILGQLEEYNIKIWGDKGWQFHFPFYPKLKEVYQGNRLNYQDLRKLYKLSTINLNMPSPQILTGFQPRVFEIAACKGFQIIDHSYELYSIFDEDKIVTFKNIDDLKEKIKFYLSHDKERNEIVNKMYKRIVNDYTWEKQIEKVFKKIL